MKLRIVATLVLALFGLVLAASPAQADEGTYLQQIRQPNQVFITVTNAQLLKLGYVGCGAMRAAINSGTSMANARGQADQAIAQAANTMGLESDRATVMNITEEAEHNLC